MIKDKIFMPYKVKLYRDGKYVGFLTDAVTEKIMLFDSRKEAETTIGIEMTQMEFAEGDWKHKIVKSK